MGDLLLFKQKPKEKEPLLLGYRLSFYTEVEIEIALLALNMYGFDKIRYTVETMKQLDPLYIRACLQKLKMSDLISHKGKRAINVIIDNMEEIRDANQI
jgi:hypothetical protein